MDKKYFERMILTNNPFMDDKSGIIRFKYYGDFDKLNNIYEDCKNNLTYIGNSNKDAAPVFQYKYDNISSTILTDFRELNVLLRKFKILKYKGEELDINEKSLLTFLKFYMSAVEENEIKGASTLEIRGFENYEQE